MVRSWDGQTSTIPADRTSVTLGRSGANDLSYPEDGGLSRQHLTLERTGDRWTVRDLGSKNGTLLNGVRIAGPTPFQPGDHVTAGHLTIEFESAAGTLPAQTVIFVEHQEDAPLHSTTIMTNLERALDQEKKVPSRAQKEVHALVRAGRELAGHRPLAELFDVILDLAIETVGAGRGVLMTAENDELVPRAVRGGQMRISSAVRDRVLSERASLLVRDAQLDEAFRERMSIVEQQVRSMMAVPLQTLDRVIGLIYVDMPNIIREFTPEDLNLLTVMANVAAIRIEHARLAEVEQSERVMEREMQQAALIQKGLLPTEAPEIPGLDIAGFNTPSRMVGGDYFDFLTYEDGRVAVLVGDAAGKGMPASLLISRLQAQVQVLFEMPDDPLAGLVGRLNRFISQRCPGNRFITLFVGIFDSKTGGVAYCNAGHNPPLVIRRKGPLETLTEGGLVLGLLPSAEYLSDNIHLDPGDTIVMFSDGITEAVRKGSDEEYGEDRVARIARENAGRSAQAIIDAIYSDLMEWTSGAPPADDMTLVVVKRV